MGVLIPHLAEAAQPGEVLAAVCGCLLGLALPSVMIGRGSGELRTALASVFELSQNLRIKPCWWRWGWGTAGGDLDPTPQSKQPSLLAH